MLKLNLITMTINITKLDNNLRVASDYMSNVETISVGAFVNTGSRNEAKEINGISHFLEHMAFKGTKKRSAKQIAEEFEGIGGKINAYTSKEKTVFYCKVLKKHAEFAVEFISDILQNSIFDEKEIEKERGVILQEIAMTNDTPDDIIFDYFHQSAYPDQSLGRSILGTIENVRKFQKQDFINYIASQYNYNNIVISSAGNLKHDDLVKYCHKYFINLGSNIIKNVEPGIYKPQDFTKQKQIEQSNIVIGYKGVSYNDNNYHLMQMIAMILGGGMSSRLFLRIREELGLAYTIYSFNYSHSDCGLLAIYCATSPKDTGKLIKAINIEIEKICQNVTKDEISRILNQYEANLLMSSESTSARMQKLGSDILNFNRYINGEEIIKKIKAYQENDITNQANKIFNSSISGLQRLVAEICPE